MTKSNTNGRLCKRARLEASQNTALGFSVANRPTQIDEHELYRHLLCTCGKPGIVFADEGPPKQRGSACQPRCSPPTCVRLVRPSVALSELGPSCSEHCGRQPLTLRSAGLAPTHLSNLVAPRIAA
jgi:hypothetical protein